MLPLTECERSGTQMAEPLRFDDGAAYERMMGIWSRIVGDTFLSWLAPKPGLSWVDVGCGNGAFTEEIVQRCAPKDVRGVDPSEGQLAFARTRPGAHLAQFQQGDAMNLPFQDGNFDVAVMALVLFFVPEPAKGVAEMARVVKPGGIVSAYAWDMLGGGFPQEPIFEELRAMGHAVTGPPHPEASQISAMQELWKDAGITEIETRVIRAERSYESFDEFWSTLKGSPSLNASTTKMSREQAEELKERVRKRLPAASDGTLTLQAWANAVKGRVRS
jgi:ubiquinone/menaquinone biosynthesis C-methylase UbiE